MLRLWVLGRSFHRPNNKKFLIRHRARCLHVTIPTYSVFNGITIGLKNLPQTLQKGVITDQKVIDDSYIEDYKMLRAKILQLKHENHISDVLLELKQYLQTHQRIDPNIVKEVIDIPELKDVFDKYPSEQTKSIIQDLPIYNEICQILEPYVTEDIGFQEAYISVAYYLGESTILSSLSEAYLSNPAPLIKSSVIQHLINGCCIDYEIETARTIFTNVVNYKKDLDPQVLSSALSSFITYNSLFQNVLYILETWMFSGNNSPTAESMSIALSQAYKFGTLQEIRGLENLIHRYGLANNYRVKLVQLKYKVINRDLHRFKKVLLPEDIYEIEVTALELRQSGDMDQLQEFYYMTLEFVSRYCYFNDIERILFKMKHDKIVMTHRFYILIMNYYVRHENFLGLIRFIESNLPKLEFDLEVLRLIYECFVRTYSTFAKDFQIGYINWIKACKMSEFQKESLLPKLWLQEVVSSIKPLIYQTKNFDPKKYKNKTWANIGANENFQDQDQIKFRVERGFNELIDRGIKPDFWIIEETFKHSHVYYKTKILELTQITRMEQKNQNRLSLVNLQWATRDERLKFYKYNVESLNSHDKIKFSRILYNNILHEEALDVLNQVDLEELNDYSYSTVLCYKLRILIHCKRYDDIIRALVEFPMNDVLLNDKLVHQCIKYEMKLNSQEAPKEVISCLRSFIGDAINIVQKDQLDLKQRVDILFNLLSVWVKDAAQNDTNTNTKNTNTKDTKDTKDTN